MGRPQVLILSTLVLLLGIAPGAYSQTAKDFSAYRVPIRKVEAKLKLDGILDEPVWQTLTPITHFIQAQPDEGAPASQRTEAFIFYDNDNIYFGFKFYDDPKKIIHRLAAHDTATGSDSADILIDTFRDRRTGYWFSVTAAGVQFDGTINEGNRGIVSGFGNIDLSWDGIWSSSVALHPWGWSAEVIIPFKSIRIPRAARQEWGVNLGREILRRQEFSYWVPVPRFEGFMRPYRTGSLPLEDIRVGRNLELIPYFSVNDRQGGRQPQLEGFSGTGGLDARYGLTANLTANLAVNPDFADTEADEFTSQISRFEIFFPEKRKFFTEGANYFTTPLQLFFTRRVGARRPDGEPQRILQGGKLTGKTGPWTIGALEALTQEGDFIDPSTQQKQTARGAFFGVLRVQRDIGQNSAVGFISVNRRQARGAVGQSESSHGVDLSLLSGQHIKWNSQVMVNLNDAHPGVDGQHMGWISDFNYNSNQYALEVEGKFLGRSVDISHTGFEPEVDRWSGLIDSTYKPFINRRGIRQLFFITNYEQSNGTRGEIEDSEATGAFQVQFTNFWTVQAAYQFGRVRFFDFTPGLQRLPTTRVYEAPAWQFQLTTPFNRALAFSLQYTTQKLVQFNENFYGFAKQFSFTTNARIGNHLRWDLSGVEVRESRRDRAFYQYRRFLISRWTYQFTHKVRTRVLAQYARDKHSNNLSINSLFAYDFTARSALFIGYNRERHVPADPGDLGNQIFFKLSYLFAF
jgi:hypothetical protein